MSQTEENGVGASESDEPQVHPQDPAEGADQPETPEPRQHAQDPAEGADDDSAE